MMSAQGEQLVSPSQGYELAMKNAIWYKKEIDEIRKIVEIPFRYPHFSKAIQVKCSRGILLCGLRLVDKTQVGLAVASKTGASFFLIKGSKLMSKSADECERSLREAFQEAEKKSRAIIFIDELELIPSRRRKTLEEPKHRIVTQLSALMDGLSKRSRVIVMGTTDVPSSIDFSLRTHGRFYHDVTIPGPLQVLRKYTKNMKPKYEEKESDDGLDSLIGDMQNFGVANK